MIDIKTDTQIKKLIKNHTEGKRSYSVAGFEGLELQLVKNKNSVTATFRHRYTKPFTTKRPYYTLGKYPQFTLVDAKYKHADNLKLLERNIDPKSHDTKNTNIPTFNDLAKTWLDEQIASGLFTTRTIEQKRKHIEYLSDIGDMPIDDIQTPDVLRVIKSIERKTIPTAKRVRGVAQKVFAIAIGHGYINQNPAIHVADLMLAKPKVKHHSAITDPEQFAKLLKDIWGVTDFYGHAQNIIKLQAMLFQRNKDMCSMRWDDIDIDAKTWTFKPRKTGNRADMVDSLVVPLPAQAMSIIEGMREQTGHTPFVFYNKRRRERYEHQQQLNKFLWRLGYKDIHTPHGFRASAITMIQEQLNYPKYLPDMQAGHKLKDSNGEAYSRVKFLDKRTGMMQKWADYIDSLK